MTVPDRTKIRSARHLAAVTVAWLAVGGLLTSAIVFTTRLGTAARPPAASPCPDGTSRTSFETCYLCSGCTPRRPPPNGINLHGYYPGQRGRRNGFQVCLCDACGVGLDSRAKERALRNWIDAEVRRIEEAGREAGTPPGTHDEWCARIRQARLVDTGPDL